MEDIHCWEKKFEPCLYSDRLLNKVDSLNRLVKQPVNITELKKSIYYARKYHGAQMRQSGESYYSHPIEVAYMLAEYAVSEAPQYYKTDILVTAVLHDTIEDTKLTEGMILDIFDKQIAEQVESLSRNKDSGKITSKEMLYSLWNKKKNDIALIKLFDRLHNIRTIGSKSSDKQQKITIETVETFLALSIYLQIPKITQELINFSSKNTDVQFSSFGFQTKDDSFRFSPLALRNESVLDRTL